MSDYGQLLHSIKFGSIDSYDFTNNRVRVEIPGESTTKYTTDVPAGWRGPKGEFSGGYPAKGTPVMLGLTTGNRYTIVAYATSNTGGNFEWNGVRRVDMSKLNKEGMWGTLITNDIHIILDPDQGVKTGDSKQYIQQDPIKKIFTANFDQHMAFSQSHRSVTGPVFRDIRVDRTRGIKGSALTDHFSQGPQGSLTKIGLDAKNSVDSAPGNTSISKSGKRNPGFVESHTTYYEFENAYGFTTDHNEIKQLDGEDPDQIGAFSRYDSRTNVLSLSMEAPNHLVETVTGTLVDLYGNILDINRAVLPNGQKELTFKGSDKPASEVYKKLRQFTSKSVAYHWELNARKPGFDLPDYNNQSDYIRARSTFFCEVDKEGQFKVNVPASSETGNVPLHTRYDNFSALNGASKNGDRTEFVRNATDGTDVKLVAFGKGFATLKSGDPDLQAYAAPLDRLTKTQITLGTVFHDLSTTMDLHKSTQPTPLYPQSYFTTIGPQITDVVSKEVVVYGDGANAGGRSGTIALDGFLSLSVGANTVDRQSLWLDTAGSIVGAIGRDRFNRSMTLQLDGDMYVQIGAEGVTGDSRFSDVQRLKNGTLDIRVVNQGGQQIIRIDSRGVYIYTPQAIEVVSQGNLTLKSRADMYLDAEGIYFYTGKSSGGRYLERSLATIP
jgi:hypothetical protein